MVLFTDKCTTAHEVKAGHADAECVLADVVEAAAMLGLSILATDAETSSLVALSDVSATAN